MHHSSIRCPEVRATTTCCHCWAKMRTPLSYDIFLGRGLSRDLLDGMYMLCEVLWCGCAACALFSCMVKPAEVKVTQHTRLLACGVLHHDVDTSVNRLCLCINNAIIVCFP